MKYLRTHSFLPTVLTLILVVGAFAVLFPKIFFVEAAPVSVMGWAWSDMPNGSNEQVTPTNHSGGRGLGWISMSSSNPNSLGGGPYQAEFSPDTGAFSGYGWSEFGGWVNMSASGGPGGNAWGARIDPTCLAGTIPCPVTGWIKYEVGGSSQSGGWDGWVSMSTQPGDSVPYSVKIDPTTGWMSGYAWGGDVVGWIEFNKVQVMLPNAPLPDVCSNILGDQDVPWMVQSQPPYIFTNSGACVQDPCYIDNTGDGYWDTVDIACWPGGAVNITATACSAGSSTINWFSWAPSGSVSCSASGGSGFSGTVGPTGTTTVNNLPDGQTTFTLGPCTDSNGNNVVIYQSGGVTTASTIVQCGTPPPPPPTSITVTLDAVPPNFQDCKNQISNLTWTVSSPNSPVTSCTGTGGFGFPASPNMSGGTIPINTTPMVNGNSYQFLVQCSNAAGDSSQDPAVIACGTIPPTEICNGVDDDNDNIGANGVAYFNPDGTPMLIDEGCGGSGGINPIYQET